ncbi:MAG: ABC transporter ATP-binding protein [Bacilli bacterium]
MNKVVEIKKLTKYYGKNRGIKDVNLSVNKGEIFGFIGPNGAGKSTTIRTILNLVFKNSGEAYIFGKNIDDNSELLRKDIGYLPSEVEYYDNMTVENLLKYSASFYGDIKQERIDFLINKLQLNRNKKFEDLSFGNRKKVGIAVALLHEPKLLILDEPTSGLDPLMQDTFFELLKEENKKGTTIFFSSHILSEVKKICDRVAIIKDGTVIKTEAIDKLTKVDSYYVTLKSKELNKLILPKGKIQIKSKYNNTIKFLFNGNTNDLIKNINKINIDEILIEEPTIEEIFMHYYKGDE